MLLKNKKILVGVTGSIAIYKTLELIRLYIKAGAQVRVIMTEGARKFINPITFEAISQNKVLTKIVKIGIRAKIIIILILENGLIFL